MPTNLYLVFGQPPEGVSWEEFDRWYYDHVRENIEVPGFIAGRRYALASTMTGSRVAPGTFESDVAGDSEQPSSLPFRHMAMYEFEGDIDELRAELFARIESGATVLPPWFDKVHWMTWTCTPIDVRVEPVRAG